LSRQKLRGLGTSGLKQQHVFIGAISDHFELTRPEFKKTTSESVGRNKNGLRNQSTAVRLNKKRSQYIIIIIIIIKRWHSVASCH